MMKRIATVLLAALAPVTLSAAEQTATPAWVEQSRELANQLGSQLKTELAGAIAAGGPVAAIAVCHTRAPEIAAQLSQASGAKVGRTALRVRNPANVPDGIERDVLEQFSADLASGKAQAPLEAVFEIDRNGQVERRYMRAIPTDALCLTCHGKSLAPEVAAAIARDYPGDQATGFEQGQLRGAFVVTWPAVSLTPTH
jgi:cytochrome c-type biogenesis protein CcmH/NrfF